ncbi:MAG: ArsR family transcriptional regulator [Candidatus Thermoplasmatota archaeon]|jgi:predicted transcriptional regulator|nr:ArsR family transcriptional regulator [Cuniculiplasma sp.]MCL4320057.1 ArsR family transcriptional regulator [Candidatus Thermoplasmatota archaeon]MCL6015459.1 ArsR family transcriptional regulator [Candidatus Thermoplasmatota archaeon]WMT49529.1 MAG: ArsR family transcriptional regulator [Thermoplasmatales archaeon]
MNDIDTLLSIMENSTRRAILKKLLMEESYGLEISKSLGISQQAINKQLEILEHANLILSMGVTPSSIGPPRKVYRPTGFSTLVIDYTPTFIQVSKFDLTERNEPSIQNEVTIERIKEINEKMDALMKERQSLVEEKNNIIQLLRKNVVERVKEGFIRQILVEYLETLNEEEVSRTTGIPVEIVGKIVDDFLG